MIMDMTVADSRSKTLADYLVSNFQLRKPERGMPEMYNTHDIT